MINIFDKLFPSYGGKVITDSKYIKDAVKNKNLEDVVKDIDNELARQQGEISALHSGNYVTVTAEGGDTSVEDIMTREGITPAVDTIYRIGAWDGTQYDDTAYSEYSWNQDDGYKFIAAHKEKGIDTDPTAGSHNLVESGGVQNELALGAVYDVSAKNPTSGPNNDGKWESLSALLSDANLNTLIPTSVRKGGMSIKFVLTSDNKYMQYFCKSDTFTTDIALWEKVVFENELNDVNLKRIIGDEGIGIELSQISVGTPSNGYYSGSVGSQLEISAISGRKYDSVNVASYIGKKIFVVLYNYGTSSGRKSVITDSNDIILVDAIEKIPTSISESYEIYELEVPVGATNLYVSHSVSATLCGVFINSGSAIIDSLQNSIENNNDSIETINDEIGEVKTNTVATVAGTAYNNTINIDIKSGSLFTVSVTGGSNMNGYFIYINGNVYESYSGDIKTNIQVNYDITSISIKRNGDKVIAAGDVTLKVSVEGILKEIDELKNKFDLVYVDAVNGSDNNDGTASRPYATFNKALLSTGEDTTIIFTGDTTEQINIKTKSNQKSIRIVGKYGHKNRIIRSRVLSSITEYQSGVYQADYYASIGGNSDIFQQDYNDVATLISDNERLPQQRGMQYRCEHTRIVKASSLQDVLDTASYSYYFDSANNKIYFRPASTDFANYPIAIPRSADNGIYGNDGTVHVELTNIEFLYCMASLDYCHGAVIKDCKAGYNYNTAGFRYNLAVGIQFIKCEAVRVKGASGVGDGFNAHANIDATEFENAPAFSKHVSATLIDCWSHDNNDDGYSDHERSETVIRGGLYEYNGKAGITPSYGSHLCCYGVISRNNYSGFLYVGDVNDVSPTEGGMYGQMLCVGCISQNNGVEQGKGVGFGVEDGKNRMVLKDCLSEGNKIGYEVGALSGSDNMATIHNCFSQSDITKVVNNGTLSIENGDKIISSDLT